jgi:hypothetical protein
MENILKNNGAYKLNQFEKQDWTAKSSDDLKGAGGRRLEI